jgi:outer membrane immunogenic protein
MRTSLLIGVCAATLVAAPAFAADMGMPVKAPPPPAAPVFTWTGIYIGANIGGAWSNGTATDNVTGVSFDTNNSGFIGGGQVGLNWQLNNFLLGVEWDIDGTTISHTGAAVTALRGPLAGDVFQGSANTDWISTLTGRIGFAFDHWLFYAKGGGAWVQNSVTLTNLTTGGSASASNTNGGWTAGVGAEWAFAPQWSAKLEYDYIKLDDFSPALLGDNVTLSRHFNMVKAGINYRFDWGGGLFRGY